MISTFEQKYIEEDFDKKEELRKQFVNEFPLGSIKGGSAHKHKVFFIQSQKNPCDIYKATRDGKINIYKLFN